MSRPIGPSPNVPSKSPRVSVAPPATVPPPSHSLALLRRRLEQLGRRRRAVRLATAAVTGLFVLIAVVAGLFAVDYLGDPVPWLRAVVLTAAALGAVWLGWRITKRWLLSRESLIDLALMVDHRQGLDGELVAALQFEGDPAAELGSSQLKSAVVDYVDEATRDLPIVDQFTWGPLPRRLALLLGAIAVAGIAALLIPSYLRAFGQRLLLADVSYPTRTTIRSASVNDQSLLSPEGRGSASVLSDSEFRFPAGGPLRFAAEVGGDVPSVGTLILRTAAGVVTSLPMTREEGADAFTGGLEAFTEPLTIAMRLGDAETKPRTISPIARPLVAVTLSPTPPAYARLAAPAPPQPGTRAVYVLEGSRVGVSVAGGNKPLRSVELVFNPEQPQPVSAAQSDAPQPTRYPLVSENDGATWRLNVAGTPFERLTEPLTFALEILDADGLAPADPVTGTIRLRPDHPPRVAAAAAFPRVLPTASPEIRYAASDDYGLASVSLMVSITRGGGEAEEHVRPVPLPAGPAATARGSLRLPLDEYRLGKGDRVSVALAATDTRGDAAGETSSAEPIFLEITDREGLLASLLEADEVGAERLDAIIRRQLGLEDNRATGP